MSSGLEAMSDDDGLDRQAERERRRRNIAIALVLAGLVVLFFIMTMVRLKGHVVNFFQ
jgi:hypothetical protein